MDAAERFAIERRKVEKLLRECGPLTIRDLMPEELLVGSDDCPVKGRQQHMDAKDAVPLADEPTASTGESPQSVCKPTTASIKATGNVVPLHPDTASTPTTPLRQLPIGASESRPPTMADLSDEALAALVRTLSLQTASDRIGLVPYPEIREKFCAVNIELNLRRTLAPRFRGIRRMADFANKRRDAFLLQDRIAIDLHWLHCRGERRLISVPGSVDPAFASLLLLPEFDFASARRFACLNKKMATRAIWMNLPDDLAWQLATIESEAMNKRFYTIMHGERRAGRLSQIGYLDVLAILESCVTTRLKPQIHTWATIWMCYRMLRSADSDPAMTTVARLHAVATGRTTPLDRKDISSRLESCEKYLRNHAHTRKFTP
jgi:hypothetical protein